MKTKGTDAEISLCKSKLTDRAWYDICLTLGLDYAETSEIRLKVDKVDFKEIVRCRDCAYWDSDYCVMSFVNGGTQKDENGTCDKGIANEKK